MAEHTRKHTTSTSYICLLHDALQWCPCWSWPSAICAGGHFQGSDGANSLCAPLVLHCCNLWCGWLVWPASPNTLLALMVGAISNMRWWWLPCVTCTGGIFLACSAAYILATAIVTWTAWWWQWWWWLHWWVLSLYHWHIYILEPHFVTCTVWWWWWGQWW